jgi:hypothetical protein
MNPRDSMIDQAQQERMTRDVKIMQKVNQANREAFTQRFPGQIQHCMRLVAERLQAVLTNKPTELANPDTWTASAQEIRDLTQALENLAQLSQAYPFEEKPQ